jgi:uncharacterized membrane protein YhaH (DUF805 family)
MESVQTCLTKYADFKGRARRSEYWWFVLFGLLASVVTSWFIGDALSWIVSLALFIPQLAVGVRRLHDTNRSGAYYFFLLIPLIGAILLIVWFATEGDHSDNTYGPAPA